MVSRERVMEIARGWIGTPYHHQASVKGAGADCLGLVRGVWRDLYGCEAESPPSYSRDWAEATGSEELLAAAERHLFPIPVQAARGGDLLLFRLRPGLAAKHIAVLTGTASFVHAMEGGPACEVAISPWWRRRIAAAFSFPGVTD